MKHLILFDDVYWTGLLPLSYTKPVAELRVGILTVREKWQTILEADPYYLTQDYLSDKYPFKAGSDNIIVNMAQKPVKQRLAETLLYLKDNFGEDENGFLNIVLTRDEYANIVGTATESAIRILSQFKKEGLISTEGKQIKLEKEEELKRIE